MTSLSSSTAQVTQLLMAWSEGDQSALETLTPLVHEELHRLAHHYMKGERPGHTLQTTALINGAYLRLIDQKPHSVLCPGCDLDGVTSWWTTREAVNI